MKYIFKIASNRNFWPLVAVLFLGFLASRSLFGAGYFNMHDDLQIMRLLQLEKCFVDGQIPCRWVPDMAYGFGYPLFNYYPPLPYLIGMLFRIFDVSFVDTAKNLFILSIMASGVTMYYLAREFFGRLGGVVSSAFYIWAPYHAVDVYVRGAMNESWALVWFPLALYFAYKLIETKAKAENFKKTTMIVLGLALAWFGIFTSHNLMVIVFLPFFAIWLVAWLLYTKNFSRVIQLIFAGIWAVGLASFFTIPVLVEKSLVQTETLVAGYYEYVVHFPSIHQLLVSRYWGYGPSVWLQDDKMSFQVGWVHWVLSVILVLWAFAQLAKTKKINKMNLVVVCLVSVGWLMAFMSHPRSTPIWQAIDQLKYIQFPWRYLTVVILAFSAVAGAVPAILKGPKRWIISFGLILAVVIYSWNYFLPEKGQLGPLTDEEKLTGLAWEKQQTSGIFDYLPNTAKTAPKEARSELVAVVDGEATVLWESEGTNWATFEIQARVPSVIRMGILDFPVWKAYVNNSETEIFIPEDEPWGRMHIRIPAGTHNVRFHFEDTPVRTLSNYISVFSWSALLIAFLAIRRKR